MAVNNEQIYWGDQMKGQRGQQGQPQGQGRGQKRGSQRGRQSGQAGQRGQSGQAVGPQSAHQSSGSQERNLISSASSSTCRLLRSRSEASSASISRTRALNFASASRSSTLFSFRSPSPSASVTPGASSPGSRAASSSFFWQRRSISALRFLLDSWISASCSSSLRERSRAARSRSRWMLRISSSILRLRSSVRLRSSSSFTSRQRLQVRLCSQSKSTSSFRSIRRSSSSRAYSSEVSECRSFSSAISRSRSSLRRISVSKCSSCRSSSSPSPSPSRSPSSRSRSRSRSPSPSPSWRRWDSAGLALSPVSAMSFSSSPRRGVLGPSFCEPYISYPILILLIPNIFYLRAEALLRTGGVPLGCHCVCRDWAVGEFWEGWSLILIFISVGWRTSGRPAAGGGGTSAGSWLRSVTRTTVSSAARTASRRTTDTSAGRPGRKRSSTWQDWRSSSANRNGKQPPSENSSTISSGNGQTPEDAGVRDLITEFKELMRGLAIKDDTLIRRSLTVLRSRFGIAGRERRRWMQEHLMRMVELAMPMHFRLLLENCDNSKAFFELLGAGDQMKACRVGFSEEQKAILKQMKPKIKRTKQIYNKTLLKLHEAWSELKRHGEESQRIIDEIEEKVDHPVFIGNLLMTLDSERSRNVTAYPLNYFQQLSRETAPEQYESRYSPVEEPEDRPAFDFYFNDFN